MTNARLLLFEFEEGRFRGMVDPDRKRFETALTASAPLQDRVDALAAFAFWLASEVEEAAEQLESAKTDHARLSVVRGEVERRIKRAQLDDDIVRALERMVASTDAFVVASRRLEAAEATLNRLAAGLRVRPTSPTGEVADVVSIMLASARSHIAAGARTEEEELAWLTSRLEGLTEVEPTAPVVQRALVDALRARENRRGQPKKSERDRRSASEALEWLLRCLQLSTTASARQKARARRRK